MHQYKYPVEVILIGVCLQAPEEVIQNEEDKLSCQDLATSGFERLRYIRIAMQYARGHARSNANVH
jgi:hypothetical protein